jgi:tetratricopeptide (TPR) repeat protein
LSDQKKKDLYDLKLFYKAFNDQNQSGNPGNFDPAYRGVPKTQREREKEEYHRRRPQREAYRNYKGAPIRERLTPHTIAVTLLVIGTFVMLFLWFGEMMDHWTAKGYLERGDYATALAFDDEYGEAYFARYSHRKKFVNNLPVLLSDLNLAFRYTDEPRSDWYVERAVIYFRMDSLTRCKEDFLMAKTVNPKSDTAFFALGELHAFYLHDLKKALSYYDSTLAVKSDFYPAQFGKAYMLYRLKRFPQALEQLNVCLKMESSDRRLYFYRGSVALAMGDSTSACRDLDQSLTMGMEEAKPLVDAYCGKVLNQVP